MSEKRAEALESNTYSQPTQMPGLYPSPPTYDDTMAPNVQTHQPAPTSRPPQMIPPAPTVVVQNVQIPVGNRANRVTCPSCHEEIITNVEYSSTTKTHLIALLLCLGGCCLCAPIPYFVDSCKNANHNCPKCGAFIGTYSQ